MSRLHSPADLAAEFGDGVTARKVLDWRKQYGWPCVQVGRTIRFTDEHVAAILAKHTVAGKAETKPGAFVIDGQTRRSARRSA